MISYEKRVLSNGLRVAANRDSQSEMAAVNMLYCVGARNENPRRTGFAHLFEHLMFRGTRRVPDFDTPVQVACGENNAYTNNDYTDYYMTLPAANVETALWLESDRMTGLNITRQKLETEKKVVIEEYNQRYLNQPYGDLWLLMRSLAYERHPYRWSTIGMTPQHVADATLAEVREFYDLYYNPANAILSVSANIEPERIFTLAEKWFGQIPSTVRPRVALPAEPEQTAARRLETERDVPVSSVTVVFHMGDRLSRDFYLCDLMSDILAGGQSARMFRSLIKERRMFSSVNAYITGEVDPGLFVITGQLLPETSLEAAERALWEELERLAAEPVTDYELEKVKNKFEAETLFGEINVMNKAINLGYYEMLGDLSLINREVDIYRSITCGEVCEAAGRLFRPELSSTLIYKSCHENR